MAETLTIWDGSWPDTAPAGRCFLWASYSAPEGAISIPAYLDANGLRLRKIYLTFIQQLGDQLVDGVSLVDHLTCHDGMSMWWMSQLAEKSPFKSPNLYACLRLLALEDLLKKALLSAVQPLSVSVVSSDQEMLESVARLCTNLGLSVTTVYRREASSETRAKRVYQMLPWRLRGLLSARHMVKRWPARALRQVPWGVGTHTLFFASYFFNLGKEQTTSNRFHSHQWEALPVHLQSEGWQLNWLHHLLLTPAVKSARQALEIAAGFNRAKPAEGVHSFVESFLGVRLMGQALFEWWRIGRIASRIQARLTFCPEGSRTDLWPFLKQDWETSFRGPAGFSNSVTRRLFDRCMRELPRQTKGLYLWENQGWEAAFIYAWRRHGHGALIGVPHATLAFWHLNNYDDTLIFDAAHASGKPVPDCLAVNGPAARAMLVESGYPQSRLADVEALRFQYLAGLGARKVSDSAQKLTTIRLLMLGDFTRKQTLAMANCLSQARHRIPVPVEITYRPHPVCDVSLDELGGVAGSLSRKPLLEILHEYDWAFSSNSSSAGLDAYLGGLRVAVFLDDASLNHSPLRGEDGVYFVNDHQALAQVIEDNPVHRPGMAKKYFWLNSQLTRWSSLITQSDETSVAERE